MPDDIVFSPSTMNIELTTNCPLRCPQCYCSLMGGKNIDIDTAIYWLQEGKKAGVKEVMLSGGETLCYPHLYELISAGKKLGMKTNIALSGVGFSQYVFDELLKAGVSGIFISLNGSTDKINSLTRDGYQYAVSALKILRNNKYPNTTINWVMHSSNADDFINVVHIAEQYKVAAIVILGVKPDSKHMLSTIPSHSQIEAVKNIILSHHNGVKIYIESCFSPMLAFVCDTKLFGNMNVGNNRGCGAGRNTFSVSVDGLLSPCRHLDFYERYTSLEEYASKSQVISRLQEMRRTAPGEPCFSCRYCPNCIPCTAINVKLEDKLYRGFRNCPVYEPTSVS